MMYKVFLCALPAVGALRVSTKQPSAELGPHDPVVVVGFDSGPGELLNGRRGLIVEDAGNRYPAHAGYWLVLLEGETRLKAIKPWFLKKIVQGRDEEKTDPQSEPPFKEGDRVRNLDGRIQGTIEGPEKGHPGWWLVQIDNHDTGRFHRDNLVMQGPHSNQQSQTQKLATEKPRQDTNVAGDHLLARGLAEHFRIKEQIKKRQQESVDAEIAQQLETGQPTDSDIALELDSDTAFALQMQLQEEKALREDTAENERLFQRYMEGAR